ncbi:acyl-CoA synthetase [Nocardiopsis composta]|uniref:Long-chain acyl-CoA synthetase n=2 Tax=Nocardiopsis composta TaxID=157465 RepID=A0A7W8VEB9_9ACTN|nr:acyl-CoA synthetase [Nocardiopsis composta]MBB5432774.1 long-chain acyl-CoA synthetase [Nocardiopsis composta]
MADAPLLGFWKIARADPERTACVDPDGSRHTAGRILDRADRLVHALRALGLRAGDGVCALTPNGSAGLTVHLAAMQAGLYHTPLNWHLTGPEIGHILADSGAGALFVHERFAAEGLRGADLAGLPGRARIGIGSVPGCTGLEEFIADRPAAPPGDRTAGEAMHYTSGTTGLPKGVRRPLSGLDPDTAAELSTAFLGFFGIEPGPHHAHLVTSPTYHTAVARFGTTALHMGHTLVFMDRWDAEEALRLVERHRVTSTHMVPTHFKRLLHLPEEVRSRYDVSSMRWLVHGAAPCPPEVREAMIDWWGECVYEYYAATEGGGTVQRPEDRHAHPGSVGRPWPITELLIADEEGEELPAGETGLVYMRMQGPSFEYKGDPAKTEAGRLGGFFTLGDVGRLDAGGHLYLTDRAADVIISGGANIYPAEIENALLAHPEVMDAAVFGVPDDDWGEQVKAVVEPAEGSEPGPELAERLLASLQGRLARMKWPRSIDFIEEMPREPNGKLPKRRLRAPYWEGRADAI